MFHSLKYKFIVFDILLMILLSFHMSLAYEMNLNLLKLYLSDKPRILGMGGINLDIEEEDADLYHPAKLVYKDKNYISYIITNENVFKKNSHDWENTFIKSKESRLTGIINLIHKGIIKKSTIGFQYGIDSAKGYADYTKESFQFDYNKSTRYKVLTFGIQAGEFWALGGGVEEYNENTDFYWEADLRADPFFSMSVREFTREFHLDLFMKEDDIQGLIPINYSEEALEIIMNINLHKWLAVNFLIDGNPHNRKIIRIFSNISERFLLTYLRQYGSLKYHQDFFMNGGESGYNNGENGGDSGHNNGEAEYSSWSAGLDFRRKKGTKYSFNLRKLDFSTDGAGLLKAEAVLSFWESLLAGKRYFNYNMGFKSTQYHFGAESRWTDRLTMRGGLQYIEVIPEGNLNHWTPFLFFGIGKMDEHITELSYSKITLGIVSLGFSYRIKSFEVTYDFGQYIPISIEKKDEKVIEDDKGEEKKWYSISWDDIKDVWKKIKDSPGGTLHVLEFRWYF